MKLQRVDDRPDKGATAFPGGSPLPPNLYPDNPYASELEPDSDDDMESDLSLSEQERQQRELARRVETLEDYSVRVTLYDGTIVELRDMKGSDLKAIEKMGNQGAIEKTMRLITRLCTKWGDRPGIALPELDNVRAKDLTLLGLVLSKFL